MGTTISLGIHEIVDRQDGGDYAMNFFRISKSNV